MRYLIVRRALILLSALGVAATGCDNSCEGVYRCPPVSATGGEAGSGSADPCPEDPAAGGVENECGVWVSASWGNDESGGTQEAPVATIARAVTLAEGRTGRVYVCGELYQEVVQLPGGVSLSGGFSCKGGVWSYDGEDRKATIAPGFPAIASMLLREGTGQSLITDLRVEAVNAVEPGASSIAVMAFGGAEATFDRCTLVAGNGADGADGKNGGHSGAPAHPGLPGNPGDHACTANPGLGGLAVKLDCDGVVTSGGNGGDGGNGFASGGFPGLQPPDPNPEGYGAGGKAQDAVQSTLCTPGIGGIQGNSGDHGAGGTDWGRLTVDGFIGAPGADGFPGTPGQGGGGGGGSIGSAICGAGAPGAPHGGAGGGSGGTGGCGGGAGKGGQGGGSSFGIAALEARLTLHKIEFILGNGGNGGNGGALQLGGQGGFPGLGGLGFGGVAGVTAGCHGGAGGQGGSGGNGGGGRGGHSFAHVSLSGDAILSPGPIEYTKFGTHGAGGKGGNANLEGTSGLVGFVGTGAILVP